jgi:hypothetical protein
MVHVPRARVRCIAYMYMHETSLRSRERYLAYEELSGL